MRGKNQILWKQDRDGIGVENENAWQPYNLGNYLCKHKMIKKSTPKPKPYKQLKGV